MVQDTVPHVSQASSAASAEHESATGAEHESAAGAEHEGAEGAEPEGTAGAEDEPPPTEEELKAAAELRAVQQEHDRIAKANSPWRRQRSVQLGKGRGKHAGKQKPKGNAGNRGKNPTKKGEGSTPHAGVLARERATPAVLNHIRKAFSCPACEAKRKMSKPRPPAHCS